MSVTQGISILLQQLSLHTSYTIDSHSESLAIRCKSIPFLSLIMFNSCELINNYHKSGNFHSRFFFFKVSLVFCTGKYFLILVFLDSNENCMTIKI